VSIFSIARVNYQYNKIQHIPGVSIFSIIRVTGITKFSIILRVSLFSIVRVTVYILWVSIFSIVRVTGITKFSIFLRVSIFSIVRVTSTTKLSIFLWVSIFSIVRVISTTKLSIFSECLYSALLELPVKQNSAYSLSVHIQHWKGHNYFKNSVFFPLCLIIFSILKGYR
jgi:hypothetical protein